MIDINKTETAIEVLPCRDRILSSLKVKYTIVHQISGRLRLRVPKLAVDSDYAQQLEYLVSSEPYVTQVRLKPAAASIAISYQTKLLSAREVKARLQQLLQAAALYPQEWVKPQILETTSTQDWSELKLPALATVLALLRELGKVPIPRTAVAASVTLAGFPVFQRAVKSLVKHKKLNIDCLDLFALIFSSLQGQWLTPALLLTLHEIGDILRDRTARASQHQAEDLLATLGHFAWVDRNGKQQIPIDEVEVGDTVIVYPGEQIPVDGTVIKGTALIDQQKLTGESMSIVSEVGQSVYASTLVRSGEIYLTAERIGNQTRAGASIELVKQAPVRDTRMENYAAQIADCAIVPSLLVAGGVLAVTANPARAASILTLDFVTGIRVSLPTTFLAALNHATRHGVLIRSGRALEKLAQVDTLVFDKTGTLTQGDLQVVDVKTVKGRMSATRVLSLAAAAEQRLTHPLAEAAIDYAKSRGIAILPRGEWNYEIGLGVRAEIDGETVLVGSDRFLQQAGISLDCFYDRHPCLTGRCHNYPNCPILAHASLMYVASNGVFQGAIKYADPLRPESQQVLAQLQSQYGMEIHLLTGDSQHRAIAVASALSIPLGQVHAEAFPEQKAEIVRQLNASGKTVAFVGDGLNDSVALTYADVSISFGDGSEVARETADVVLMNNNLTSLLDAIAIARETKGVIRQNIGLSVVPNLAALSLASTVGLHPLAATVVHNGSAIAAGLNGLRPLMHSHSSH